MAAHLLKTPARRRTAAPSVLTVVLAALAIAFSVSAVLTRQVSELAVDINDKLDDLRDAAADNELPYLGDAAQERSGYENLGLSLRNP